MWLRKSSKPMMKMFSPLSNMMVAWSGKMESRLISKKAGIADTNKEELDKAIELTVEADADSEEADILKGIIKFGNVSAKQILKFEHCNRLERRS